MQKALYENETDARSAARAIDLYKVDMKIADTKKEKSDKGAASLVTAKNTSNVAKTKSSQSNQWRESQVAKMKAHEYEKNELSWRLYNLATSFMMCQDKNLFTFILFYGKI